MRRQLLCSGCSLIGMAFLFQLAACSKNNAVAMDSGHPDSDAGTSPDDGGCKPSASDNSYVLIDDMEMGTNGPIDLDGGLTSPLTLGYWYNSGASYRADGGAGSDDKSTPTQGSFAFTSLSMPTNTLNCKTSAHAARQECELSGLYDTCGIGFEFAQKPDPDAGAPSGTDAGQPKVTVPFDISHYKAVTFWGMTTTPDPMTGSLHVKIQFPDTDTDPRGQVCNGGSADNSSCYNSYAAYFEFTTSWQQFTVLLDAGKDGVPPTGGIAIDQSWGFRGAQWIPTQVYGINWQAQRNTPPDAGAPLMTDIWIDDVYFKE
jgi:hypothetical protein